MLFSEISFVDEDDINTMKILQTLQTEYFYANVTTKVVTDFELNCSKNKYY